MSELNGISKAVDGIEKKMGAISEEIEGIEKVKGGNTNISHRNNRCLCFTNGVLHKLRLHVAIFVSRFMFKLAWNPHWCVYTRNLIVFIM